MKTEEQSKTEASRALSHPVETIEDVQSVFGDIVAHHKGEKKPVRSIQNRLLVILFFPT